jgi:hypothetical protein
MILRRGPKIVPLSYKSDENCKPGKYASMGALNRGIKDPYRRFPVSSSWRST